MIASKCYNVLWYCYHVHWNVVWLIVWFDLLLFVKKVKLNALKRLFGNFNKVILKQSHLYTQTMNHVSCIKNEHWTVNTHSANFMDLICQLSLQFHFSSPYFLITVIKSTLFVFKMFTLFLLYFFHSLITISVAVSLGYNVQFKVANISDKCKLHHRHNQCDGFSHVMTAAIPFSTSFGFSAFN